MKKILLTGLLLTFSMQSQLAHADYTDELLEDIREFIGANGGNDILSKLNSLHTMLNVVDVPPINTAARTTTPAGNKANANIDAQNAQIAGKNLAPNVANKQLSIQANTQSDATRQYASNELKKSILDSGTSALDASGRAIVVPLTASDANGNPIKVPVGGLSFDWGNCGTAADLGKKKCAEDETHLANKEPSSWKDEATKKLIAQVALRDEEQKHKKALTLCKSNFEKLAANNDPNLETCSGLGIDAVTIASLRAKALPKYTNYTNSETSRIAYQDGVNTINDELTLTQHQQRIIRLVLAERAVTDKSCNILDTKDLSILEPATPVTPATVTASNTVLTPLTTAASIAPLASPSGTYSNKYCKCIRLDSGGHCTEGIAVNFASKRVNAEMTQLDCELDITDVTTNKCKTTPILVGYDSNDLPVYVNATIKARSSKEAMDLAAKALADAGKTPDEIAAYKAAYTKRTARSVAFY